MFTLPDQEVERLVHIVSVLIVFIEAHDSPKGDTPSLNNSSGLNVFVEEQVFQRPTANEMSVSYCCSGDLHPDSVGIKVLILKHAQQFGHGGDYA